MIRGAERIVLEHHGLRFTAYEMGQGPLVLLLHGFPDTPATFEHQLPALAAAGYRAVAVTLRGYEPSSLVADGSHHVATLAHDVIGHLDALGVGRAHLVGHDWGGSIGYAAAALAPERLRSFTALAVPHPARFAALLGEDPEQQRRIDYIMFFLQGDAADERVADPSGEYLESLWHRWSPDWRFTEAEFAPVRAAFAVPGVAKASLSYYRQAMDATSALGLEGLQLFGTPIQVPTLVLCGASDGCIAADFVGRAMNGEGFAGGLQTQVIEGGGHFLHRERADDVNRKLLAFLRTHDGRA